MKRSLKATKRPKIATRMSRKTTTKRPKTVMRSLKAKKLTRKKIREAMKAMSSDR